MSELNGYDLSRAWFDFCYENPEKIKPNHTALYFFAIEHCNRLGWKKVFGLPTTMAMEAIGIRSYNTYKKTLDDLVSWKFIKMVEVSKNQYSANKITLSNFNKALNNALDKALIKHTTKQSESTGESIDSIDKQETINHKQETKNKGTKKRFVRPTKEELIDFFKEKGLVEYRANEKAEAFINHYTSNGWKVGKNPMKSWQAAAGGIWMKDENQANTNNNPLHLGEQNYNEE